MGIFRKSKEELLAQAETKAAQARNSHTGSPCPAADHNISVTKLLRCAEGGWLRPQAEKALINAAKEGDLATLKRLVEQGVDVNAVDEVSAALPAAPTLSSPRRPPPLLPRLHRRRSPRVAPPPRLRRTPASRPSCERLPTASSPPLAPTLR